MSRGTDAAAVPSRRSRVRAATSLEIRQAARRILIRQGLEALTLRAIARDLGMTGPALYRYFGSREDLVTHLAADILLEVTEDVRAAIKVAGRAGHADATARLTAARQEFRHWSLSHRAEFGLVFAVPLPRVGQHDIAAQCGQKFARAFLGLFLERWQDGPAPASPELTTVEAREPLEYLSGWLGADVRAEPVLAFLGCWVRLHAAVALEVSGYPGIAPGESDPFQAYSAWPQPGHRPGHDENRPHDPMARGIRP